MAERVEAAILDMTDVKDRGNYNPVHVEPGEYAMKITGVKAQDSAKGNPMWVFTLVHVNPPSPSAKRGSYPVHCVLDVKSLWKIRQLFIAAGFQVPRSKIKLDPNKVIGRVIGAILEDDEYEGKVRSKAGQILPLEEIETSAPASTPTDGADEDMPVDDAPVTDDDMDGVDL